MAAKDDRPLRAGDELERERARRAAVEERLAAIERAARVGYWEHDLLTGGLVWSDGVFRLMGVPPQPATPELYLQRIHPDDRAAVVASLRSMIGGASGKRFEHRFVHPDGTVVEVRNDVTVFLGEGGQPARTVGYVTDITETKRLERELEQSGRLATIGTLALGVAHEINNPLTYVTGNLELSASYLTRLAKTVNELGPPPALGLPATVRETARFVEEGRDGARRIQEIVKDLKSLARPPVEGAEGPVAAEEVLESSVRIAWNEIRHRAKLVRDYQPVPRVRGSESRLGQIFLNLLVNAAQAIPEGQVDRNEIRLRLSPGRPGEVIVEICDTGVGVAPEDMERLFDPFFTRRAGAGMGLGLSICRRLVAVLGGEMTCESTPGRGTTFRVALPAEEGPPSAESARPGRPADAPPRHRVLVIDDEPLVGRLMKSVLEGVHDVTVTTSSREALTLVSAGQRFDAVLCDLMMPEHTGIEFQRRLDALDPGLAARIVFVTGGAFGPVEEEILRGDHIVVEKPFQTADLLEAIARVVTR